MILYHGSNVVVEKPEILTNGFYKDFGFGFYCTNKEEQAKKWALTKKYNHIVNVYNYEENQNLKILKFESMTEQWLDFVVDCRRGKEHNFDIVEGPMADDTIWDYIEDFVAQKISRKAFWALVEFKYPTHQISFCTTQALKCINFTKAYNYEK